MGLGKGDGRRVLEDDKEQDDEGAAEVDGKVQVRDNLGGAHGIQVF